MNKLLIILFLIASCTASHAQCMDLQIALESQEDVDRFIEISMGCDSIKYLNITARSPIHNLDSLYRLTYVDDIRVKLVRGGVDTKGLRNLQGANMLSWDLYQGQDTLYSLEKVNRLIVNFPLQDTTLNLSIFLKLNFIESFLVRNSGRFDGLSEFNSNDSFVVSIKSNRLSNSISKVLPENQTKIRRIDITDSENIIIDDLKSIRQINYLFFENNFNIDFRPLRKINKVNSLALYDIIGNDNIIFGDAFYKIDTLEYLSIIRNKNPVDFYNLIPNLTNIKGRLQIKENISRINLQFFRNFSLLGGQGSPAVTYRYLDIVDNKEITGCNNRFICQNLLLNPDSSRVENNTDGCNLEDILSYCITLTEELEEEATSIYPNPTSSMIYLMGSRIERVEVIDQIGRLVFNGASTTIDLTNQPNGLYLLRIHKKDGTIQTEKVIKI